MSLSDFSKPTGFELGDFSSDEGHDVYMGEGTANSVSSHGLFLAHPGNEREHLRTMREDVNRNDFTQFEDAADEIAASDEASRKEAIENIVLDPARSDAEKNAAIEQGTVTMSKGSTELLHDSFVKEESTGETVEEERIRIQNSAFNSGLSDHLEWKQNMSNNGILAKDPGFGKMAADFIELMIPFTESAQTGHALELIRGGDEGGRAKGFLLMGEAKEEIRDIFRSMSLAERRQAGTLLEEMITRASQNPLSNGNVFFQKQLMEMLVNGGDYDNVDRWIDNAVSILDILPFGPALTRSAKTAVRTVKGKKNTAKISKAYTEAIERHTKAADTQTTVDATSPAEVAKGTNPNVSREIHKEVVEDLTDETATVTHGTTRTEAIGNDVLPESRLEGADTRNKTTNIDELEGEVKVGALSPSEQASASGTVAARIDKALDPVLKKEMATTSSTPIGSVITRIWGTAEGGYGNASDALDLVSQAVAKYGVKRDELQIMRKNSNGDYVLAREGDAGNDFVVKMDHHYTAENADVSVWDKMDMKRNSLDREPTLSKWGFVRGMFDPASIFEQTVTWAANRNVDRASAYSNELTKLGKTFLGDMRGLNKQAQDDVWDYLVKANSEGIAHNAASLRGKYRMTDKQIKSVESFRDFWDTSYRVKNRLAGDTLTAQGFKHYKDADTDLFVKPMEKGVVPRGQKGYNPSTGQVEDITDETITALYESGGTVSKSRRPIGVDDESVSYVILQDQSKMGKVGANSPVIKYREGYYETTYKAPHYIIERVKDNSKRGYYEKAVATAGSVKDSRAQVAMLNKNNPTEAGKADRFSSRRDAKGANEDDFEFDLDVTSSQSTQRIRGKQLEGGNSMHKNADTKHVSSPVDSMIESVANLSRKASMSDYLNSYKARYLDNYKDVLGVDDFGKPKFPESISEIGLVGRSTDKLAGDARTAYNHIRMLEQGYANGLDDSIQAILNGIATIAGSKTSTGERVLRAAAASDVTRPTDMLRKASFNMYLALNPLRQIIVQGHQATLLAANFPQYAVKGMAQDVAVMAAFRTGITPNKAMLKASGRSAEEWALMFKEYEKSGIPASISQNNIQRSGLMDIADTQASLGRGNVLTSPLRGAKRIGYDVGEEMNMMTAWLAHYDRTKKAKGNLDANDWLSVQGGARSYTYNMNAAGDMPYNQGGIGVLMQFMQVPHKAVLQSFNRALSPNERRRLFAYNALMLPMNPAMATKVYGDLLPEEGELREALLSGLEGHMLNKALTHMAGEDVRIDWASLGATDMVGQSELILSLFDGNLMDILAATPSGALLFGNNARLTEAFKSVGRFTGAMEDFSDPTTATMLIKDIASLSSGMSNYYKAEVLFKEHKRRGVRGDTDETDTPTMSAIAQLFGFRDYDEAVMYQVGSAVYTASNEYREDIKQYVDELERHAVKLGLDKDSDEWIPRMMSMLVTGLPDNLQRRDDVYKLIIQRLDSGDTRLFQGLRKLLPTMNPSYSKRLINALPESPEKKELLNRHKFINQQEGL